MRLYLRESPRTLYLATDPQDDPGRPSRALVFRAAEGSSSQAVVEFLPKDEVDLTTTIKLAPGRVIRGCLGLISVSNGASCGVSPRHWHIHKAHTEIFLVVITSATLVGKTRPTASTEENVAQIHDVGFYSVNSSTWDGLSTDLGQRTGYDDQDSPLGDSFATPTPNPVFEHPCSPITKILSTGTFYYAHEDQWDITSRLPLRLARRESAGTVDAGLYDERFLWNEYIVKSLLEFRERLDSPERDELDQTRFIVCLAHAYMDRCVTNAQVLAMQGFVGVYTLALPAPPTSGAPTIATLALISRLGWKRSGTRFNTRGVDDDGNVANFVEVRSCLEYARRGMAELLA